MKFKDILTEASQPKEVTSIWDNGGETADRYSIVMNWKETPTMYAILGLSDNPESPQGFSQFTHGQAGKHLGKKLKWNQLPPKIQKHIVSRLAESNEINEDKDLSEATVRVDNITFPNVKGWTVSKLGSEYTDDGAENVRYSKKTKGGKVDVTFSDLDMKSKTWRAVTGGSIIQATDGKTKMTRTSGIRGDWKDIKDIPKVLASLEKDFKL